MAWGVLSWVAEMTSDVLCGMANLCWMFCLECQKMALDVLFRDDVPGSLTDNMSSIFMWHCC